MRDCSRYFSLAVAVAPVMVKGAAKGAAKRAVNGAMKRELRM